MTVLERVAFTWVLSWVLMDSIIPNELYAEKLKITMIVTASIAYLFNLHGIVYKKLKNFIKTH